MPPLPSDLRKELDKAVVRARDTAEAGAAAAMDHLGVGAPEAPTGLTPEQRALRVALRAQARALGREVAPFGLDELREEIAYGAWHRMLFARFLAENGLLVHQDTRSPVSMDDVAELAHDGGESDPWVLAARYAAAMLPGIFGTTDPTTQVVLAPDDRLRLEAILKELPTEVFTSDDALGWVYQFWQSRRKKEVNAKGDKIGGADLAPVTQLFTEHYMVRFLLENSLGAWWAGRHPDSPLLRDWEYLRYRDDGTPAAGTFEGWPTKAADITVMDPCCGSGHFLVAAADMLRAMRMEEEGLTVERAAEAVLRDNLFGLELDPRCTQIAAFALAFDAWKTIGRAKLLPVPNLACSGIAIKGQRDDWHKLGKGDDAMTAALDRLYDVFVDAPELGSLIDPRAAAQEGTVWAVDPDKLIDKLEQALSRETATDPAAAVFGGAAAGTAKAARLLAGRYWLVATNPPFLSRGKQGDKLKLTLGRLYPDAAADLSTALLVHASTLANPRGSIAFVTPQTWQFLGTFARLREWALGSVSLTLTLRLGNESFWTPMWSFGIALVVIRIEAPSRKSIIAVGSVEGWKGPEGKAAGSKSLTMALIPVALQMANPGHAITLDEGSSLPMLSEFAVAKVGIQSGDYPQFIASFWELAEFADDTWVLMQSAPSTSGSWDGFDTAIRWEGGDGSLHRLVRAKLGGQVGAWIRGTNLRGKPGVLVGRMADLKVAHYGGSLFADTSVVIAPTDPAHLAAVWSFCLSPSFAHEVRRIDQKVSVTNSTMTKVPFDLEHWTKVAAEQYPNGLPEPHSDDPTQWLFNGQPVGSDAPLQVAVARLLGYRWPDQEPDELDEPADPDGIVCLPSVAGDAPAAERLERLLARAYGADWTPARRARLLADAGSPGATLETWLRDDFFAQHARLFHNRPFIWHVWDGRKDGFSALLHYHRLDRATLGKLTYTQLGDWIERQRAAQAAGEAGADARLAAAVDLQRKLAAILEGEPPFDIYVRWKTLAEQPIGWDPDLDDGVRLNIRPFVEAGVLRAKFTINWNKDRGKDPDGSERLNDPHFSIAQRRSAQAVRA